MTQKKENYFNNKVSPGSSLNASLKLPLELTVSTLNIVPYAPL